MTPDRAKTGTYKEEFGKGSGWAVQKIGMPKFIGYSQAKISYESNFGITQEHTLIEKKQYSY